MKYLSVCSGIESASCAWHPLGWTPIAFAEIEPFPCSVLKHRFPNVPNLGDMTRYKEWKLSDDPDVLVGGTPCQSFSVAGLRKGMADPRGNLALVFLGIADRFRPTFVVWENVPGVHSSWSDEEAFAPSEKSRGTIEEARRIGIATGLDIGSIFGPDDFEEVDQTNDFDCFLAGLEELGYGVATTILDAQWFGLAQRRERVFVVGCLGGWNRSAAVLFDKISLSRDTPPGREKRKDIAGTLEASLGGRCGQPNDHDPAGGLTVGTKWPAEIAPTLNAHFGDKQGLEDQHISGGAGLFVPGPQTPQVAGTLGANHGNIKAEHAWTGQLVSMTLPASTGGVSSGMHPVIPMFASGHHGDNGAGIGLEGDPAFILDTKGSLAVAYACQGSNVGESGTLRKGNGSVSGGVPFGLFGWTGDTTPKSADDLMPTIRAEQGGEGFGVGGHMGVRRLTPTECERLMGFPDNWTLVPHRGKPASDGPRYKAIGNSMAVPCMRWIGERIQMVADIGKEQS